METKTVKVPNIGCDGCVKAIQTEVSEVAGVVKVDGNPDTQMVTIKWENPADWNAIKSKMAEIDYAPADS